MVPDGNTSVRIFDIQRSCSGDGPGIRTTVFFQGCPLHCPWCHNPESRSFAPRVSFRAASCLGCGKCVKMEPSGQCRRAPEKLCTACGVCVRECPGGALTLLGRTMRAKDIIEIVKRDRFYYDRTSGGMTLSGGEPFAQSEGALALAVLAAKEGISTAVETALAFSGEILGPFTGRDILFLTDIKAGRSDYEKLTGADPETVFSNLRYLSDAGEKIVLRVPMIEGYNVTDDLLAFLKECRKLPGVQGVDLLAYHALGRGKARMAGYPEPPWDTMSSPSEDLLSEWKKELDAE